jgi:SET domain-containing protein
MYNTSPPKLAVWKSRISGGGKGLFALEPIKKGRYLGDYTGERVAVSDTTNLSSNPRVALFDICAGEPRRASWTHDTS